MALYDYKCLSCQGVVELSKRISERDLLKDDVCPHCGDKGSLERSVSSALVAYSVMTPGGYGKIPDGFRDVLNRIHERAPGSRLDKTSSFL